MGGVGDGGSGWRRGLDCDVGLVLEVCGVLELGVVMKKG